MKKLNAFESCLVWIHLFNTAAVSIASKMANEIALACYFSTSDNRLVIGCNQKIEVTACEIFTAKEVILGVSQGISLYKPRI